MLVPATNYQQPVTPYDLAMTAPRQPVAPDDLRAAARLCTATLWPALAADWSVNAHGLEWSCRRTLDHLGDAFAYYAANMGAEPPQSPYGPYGERADASVEELLASIEPLADLVAETAGRLPAATVIPHLWGATDPEGILAMGVVELLVHSWDIGQGVGAELSEPAASELAAGALARLFPESPAGSPPLDALLFATGRIALPDRPKLAAWRWHSAPLTDR